MNIVAPSAMPNNSVTIHTRVYAHGTRYAWLHKRHAGCTVYGSQDFTTAWEAWLAAATVALCNQCRLVAPQHVQDQLTSYWLLKGRHYFNDGLTRDVCANQFERGGWDLASAELDAQIAEALGKPFLDWAPTTVYPHELAVA